MTQGSQPRANGSSSRGRAKVTAPGGEMLNAIPSDVLPETDLGNAHRVVAQHGNELRFAKGLGWLVYDKRRFVVDATGRAQRRAHAVARAIVGEATRLAAAAALAGPGSGDAKRYLAEARRKRKWAKQSQNAGRLRASLEIAAVLPPIATAPDAFDQDKFLLNCRNGTLDLANGKLRPHRATDLITKLAPTDFDAEAHHPTWTAFLNRIFNGSESMIQYVQRAVGYGLTGDTREQVFFVLHGSGANGKSTFLEAVRLVLGAEFAVQTSTDTLVQINTHRGADNDLARLRGARFVTAVESAEGRRLDEERIKRLTGGDTITARKLYQEAFEFEPTFKIWLACNSRPEVKGTDHAIWRRIRLIPFNVTIPEREQDRELRQKLHAEASGILRWAVEGCAEWIRGGLNAPNEVMLATQAYRDEEDVVGRFVRERCTVNAALSGPASALYGAFSAWAKTEGEEPLTKKAFGRRLAGQGFVQDRTSSARLWRGLAPRVEEDDT